MPFVSFALLSLWLLLVAFQICVDLTRVATISCEQLKNCCLIAEYAHKAWLNQRSVVECRKRY